MGKPIVWPESIIINGVIYKLGEVSDYLVKTDQNLILNALHRGMNTKIIFEFEAEPIGFKPPEDKSAQE